MSLQEELTQFQNDKNITTKGALSLVVQITRKCKNMDFPVDSKDFLTEKQGQVAGLGGGNLRKILAEHGINRILASEGGRTSRGNMELMIAYVRKLNELHENHILDLNQTEDFWANAVTQYFNNLPFTLNSDASKTISANLDDLFAQAKQRQSENPGTQYLGTMLQHLVAAKLSVIMPANSFEIHGANVADAPTDRNGDFVINSTVIHCTTSPGQPLMEKCRANIDAGCHPVIITISERVHTAQTIAEDYGILDRVDVWDIQQFISTNIYEHSLFDETQRNSTIAEIVDAYNNIIDEQETDPSLKIQLA